MAEGVFVPLCSSIRLIRDAVKKAVLAGTKAAPFTICDEDYYYPGMIDVVLRDPVRVAALSSSAQNHGDVSQLSCIALWDLQTQEGVALCALNDTVIATSLPPISPAQLQKESDCLQQLRTLAKQTENIPLSIDRPIMPGQYTLADILQFIRQSP